MRPNLVVINDDDDCYQNIYVIPLSDQIMLTLVHVKDFWTPENDWHGKRLREAQASKERVLSRFDVINEEKLVDYDTCVFFATWLHNTMNDIETEDYNNNALCLFHSPSNEDECKCSDEVHAYIGCGLMKHLNKEQLTGDHKQRMRIYQMACIDPCFELSVKEDVDTDQLLQDLLWSNEVFIIDESTAYLVYGLLAKMFPDWRTHELFRRLRMICLDWKSYLLRIGHAV